jgi:ribonuclease Z
MKNDETTTLPTLALAGGTKAVTLTPVVGTPRRAYAEEFVPGEEPIEDGELRVTVLGSGNPWSTRRITWSPSAVRSGPSTSK